MEKNLAKAAADARHFLLQFRSVQKMAETLDSLDRVRLEVDELVEAKKVAEAELVKVKPKLGKVKKELLKAEAKLERISAEAVRVRTTAIVDTQKTYKSSEAAVLATHDTLNRELAAKRAAFEQDRRDFEAWSKIAEAKKVEAARELSNFKVELDKLRAKLL